MQHIQIFLPYNWAPYKTHEEFPATRCRAVDSPATARPRMLCFDPEMLGAAGNPPWGMSLVSVDHDIQWKRNISGFLSEDYYPTRISTTWGTYRESIVFFL